MIYGYVRVSTAIGLGLVSEVERALISQRTKEALAREKAGKAEEGEGLERRVCLYLKQTDLQF